MFTLFKGLGASSPPPPPSPSPPPPPPPPPDDDDGAGSVEEWDDTFGPFLHVPSEAVDWPRPLVVVRKTSSTFFWLRKLSLAFCEIPAWEWALTSAAELDRASEAVAGLGLPSTPDEDVPPDLRLHPPPVPAFAFFVPAVPAVPPPPPPPDFPLFQIRNKPRFDIDAHPAIEMLSRQPSGEILDLIRRMPRPRVVRTGILFRPQVGDTYERWDSPEVHWVFYLQLRLSPDILIHPTPSPDIWRLPRATNIEIRAASLAAYSPPSPSPPSSPPDDDDDDEEEEEGSRCRLM
jgi:hypothetical protein